MCIRNVIYKKKKYIINGVNRLMKRRTQNRLVNIVDNNVTVINIMKMDFIKKEITRQFAETL